MLADYMTVKENFGHLDGIKLTYVGDGRNNVANSLLVAGPMLGVDVTICSPKALFPSQDYMILLKDVPNKTVVQSQLQIY